MSSTEPTADSPLADAPRDGTRVLLRFWTYSYSSRLHDYVREKEPKWEECRWIANPLTGSKPHWNPWCGNEHSTSSHHIYDKDVVTWMPLPQPNLRSKQFYVRYKNRIPDPGVCLVREVNWERQRLEVSNGRCTYFPSFAEVIEVPEPVSHG